MTRLNGWPLSAVQGDVGHPVRLGRARPPGTSSPGGCWRSARRRGCRRAVARCPSTRPAGRLPRARARARRAGGADKVIEGSTQPARSEFPADAAGQVLDQRRDGPLRPRRPSRPAGSRATIADPTMTASAYDATSAACRPFETPRPTPTGRSVTSRTRATSAGPASLVDVARPGHAHDRGGVDEAAAGRGRGAQPLGRRRRRDQEHLVELVRIGRGDPLLRLVRDQVRRDQPGAAGRCQLGGEALDAVPLDRVPVRHDQGRGRARRPPPRPGRRRWCGCRRRARPRRPPGSSGRPSPGPSTAARPRRRRPRSRRASGWSRSTAATVGNPAGR